MRLDFSEVKEAVPAEEGTRVFTIVAAEEKLSKNGTNMLKITLKDDAEGLVSDNVCLEGPGAFKAKQFAKALNLDEETFAAMEASELVGLPVTVEIVKEEYEGELRSKVKKYLA